jgi:hypothetical protein
MNPYVYTIPTDIIIYLYNIIKMYSNPLACISMEDSNYVLIDMLSFNPYWMETRKQYLLYKLEQSIVRFEFYYANFDSNAVLISLEPVLNILDSILQIEKVYSFFTYRDEKNDLNFNILNINQIKNYKNVINSILNLPGPIYMIDGLFLMSFVTFQNGSELSTVPTITSFWNPTIQKWDSSRIVYDILNGTVIGTIDSKPIFSINFKELLMYNNVYYLEYNKNDINSLFVGSTRSFLYKKVSKTIANIANAKELNYMTPMNGNDIIDYQPLDSYYFILCIGGDRSNFYLCGFTGINSPDNFFSIIQSGVYLKNVQTMFYSIIYSYFVFQMLEEEPIFNFDGCIIWFVSEPVSFYIYQPTFSSFLEKHSIAYQGVSDLKF